NYQQGRQDDGNRSHGCTPQLLSRTAGARRGRGFAQKTSELRVAAPRRDADCGLSLGDGVDVRAALEEQLDDVERIAIVLDRLQERRVAAIVSGVHVRALLEQQLHRG